MKQSKKDRKIAKLQEKLCELKKQLERNQDTGPAVFSGRGILFTVFENTKSAMPGPLSTTAIIEQAISEARSCGNETDAEIAQYITTHSFHHVTDRHARFNSVLKAGDVVGANISAKLFNSYNELRDQESDDEYSAINEAHTRGFAEAMTITFSPLSVEDDNDRNLVNWDEVDRLTDLMEEQQEEARNML